MIVRAGIFPETSTVFEAVEQTRKLYPNGEGFMVYEVEDLCWFTFSPLSPQLNNVVSAMPF